MLPKLKKYIKNNKKMVIIVIAIIIILIISLILYKALFYSSSEKAVYGVRLVDIKENEFTNDEKNEVINKAKELDGVEKVEINVKGRLIKLFVTFSDSVTNENIKTSFNTMLSYFSDRVKNYYDISFYAIKGDNYPVIGYKHKTKTEITYEEL